MESDAQQGGSRQTRAQFINCHFLAPATFTTGFARGGRLTRTGVGTFLFDPDPQPAVIGTNIAFGQGTVDPNRTSVQVFPRNAAAAAAFQSFSFVWSVNGDQLALETQAAGVAADYDFDLFILEAERSGATGAS